MINNIEILNGSMDKQFQKDIFEYNVVIPSTVFSLDFNIESDNEITIYGNDYITSGEGKVFIEVYDKELYIYTFNVIKETTLPIIKSYENTLKAEVPIKNQILNDIKTPLIFSLCFILIIILFCLIFRKKKIIRV